MMLQPRNSEHGPFAFVARGLVAAFLFIILLACARVEESLPCPRLWRDAFLGLFYGEKEGGGGIPVSGPAARATRPEPPSPMPPVFGSCLSRTTGLPAQAVWPRSPRPSGPAPPSPGHPHRFLARAESLDTGGALPGASP